MERGSVLEEFAIDEYELRTGELSEKVGFCVHDKYSWLGLSPDRLIKKKGKYRKGPSSFELIVIRMWRNEEIFYNSSLVT